MAVKNYETLEIKIITIQDDAIRTSNQAPDVYEPDPFIRN